MDERRAANLRARNFFAPADHFARDGAVASRLVLGDPHRRIPAVSVVMPTWRRPTLLGQAIRSVLSQEGFEDFELVIVDNESDTESEHAIQTMKVVRSFGSDRILYYRNERNLGSLGNCNRCLQLARAPLACMVHDDDMLVPDHLAKMTSLITRFPDIRFLACEWRFLDMRNKARGSDPVRRDDATHPPVGPGFGLHETSGSPARPGARKLAYLDHFSYNFGIRGQLLGALFDREAAIRLGGFDPDGPAMEDYAFVARFARTHGVYLLPEPLYIYRWGMNISLNPSIWELNAVGEYYLYRAISLMRPVLFRPFFRGLDRITLEERIEHLRRGDNFLGMACPVDRDAVLTACGLPNAEPSPMLGSVCGFIGKVADKLRADLVWKPRSKTLSYPGRRP